jgi:hypothetical protein
MKNNVIYINFSYQYKKKRFIALFEKLFNRNNAKPAPKYKSSEVIKIQQFDKKHIL